MSTDPAADARLKELLSAVRGGLTVFLTGAGISAESGIPTFRGEEGYWRVGSVNYQPQDLATYAAWSRMPDELWAWYLYRRSVCRAAEPNPAHRALARLETAVGAGMLVVTQNVDGLHLRAGNSVARTYQIHGNIDYMRCADECAPDQYPLPELGLWTKERKMGDAERAQLRCPVCGGRARPHVLWFDETYDEPRYRWNSSHDAAAEAAAIVIVGTSGATTLPIHMARTARHRRIPFIVVNRDPSPFTEMAEETPRGLVLWGLAGEHVPRIAELLGA